MVNRSATNNKNGQRDSQPATDRLTGQSAQNADCFSILKENAERSTQRKDQPRMMLHKSAFVGRAVISSSAISRRYKHVLPDLPYDYGALEPVISAEIMRLHHQKHHATYVNNLNVAEEKCHQTLQKGDVLAAITLQGSLKYNGGGHINHSIFWTNLCKDGGEPSGELLEQIKRDFDSLETLQEKFSAASTAVQGSGWGWLGYNKADKRLQIATCANQDPLESTTGLCPLFGIDECEHAYCLQYKNVRPDYLKATWKIANWKNVDERFQKQMSISVRQLHTSVPKRVSDNIYKTFDPNSDRHTFYIGFAIGMSMYLFYLWLYAYFIPKVKDERYRKRRKED
ncbi:iron/manganese superoxide dismutase, alpha-hairpin domain-containing protein [Ditylenchus destructor]|uniref:superoxide dismutase n=1 Tax=Ditylenchus destructor TaxID=166010 RepID=A0AAD4R5G5_9BILA|nr:iron/manganese superoxide dismutase, alpha-hairpin domain-containing protein [Ditylenchus destructor]